jgi:hypothetical protein
MPQRRKEVILQPNRGFPSPVKWAAAFLAAVPVVLLSIESAAAVVVVFAVLA